MRVGLVIYGSLDFLSGGYLYDRKLVNHLTASGDEVRVFSLPWRLYPRLMMDNFSSLWLDRFSQEPVDVMLQDELNHPSLFLLNRRLAPSVSYPIVSIVHHLRCREQRPPLAQALYQLVESAYLRSVDAFVFNSRATQSAVESLIEGVRPSLVAHPGRDRLLGPALDEKEITARVTGGGPLRLAFVGNLLKRKGLHKLLTALGLLKAEPWTLSVAGSLTMDPDYTARIGRKIGDLGLEERVQLLGAVSDHELTRLLKRSHVIAMPFSYEGFGIAYLEGMAHGLPALGCSTGGAGEIIHHGKNGFLFDPGDVRGVADSLCHLVRDKDELLRLSLAARRHFGTFPTWEKTTTRIRDFLVATVDSSNGQWS